MLFNSLRAELVSGCHTLCKGQKSTGVDVLGRVMIMCHRLRYSFGDWKHLDYYFGLVHFNIM